MNKPTLKLHDVNSYYGQLQVLMGVSLEVEDGLMTGLIGPNGAGKSTLLKTIIGRVKSSGSIHFRGERIDGLPTRSIVELGVIYVPEGRRVFPDMTVVDNLNLGAMSSAARTGREQNLSLAYEIFPILNQRRKQLAGTLSGGELQLLAIARGLMGSPQLLLIDEPSLGLSPTAVTLVFETLREINEKGKTILIVEQNVPRLLKLASYSYVLENGRITNASTTNLLEKDEGFVRSYLGI